jgi:hypothetical protein
MAYDDAEGVAVLLGTNAAGEASTWTWNGHAWTAQQSPSLPITGGMSLVYDGGRGVVLLFGGVSHGTHVAGTWTWKAGSWTEQHPATSPSPRSDATAAYDAARGKVVLFGGCCSGEGFAPTPFAETWTFDGTTWKQEHPASSPSERINAAMAYDAARGKVVLFGGYVHGSGNESNDTWIWDGTGWKLQQPAASPPDQGSHAEMAYAAESQNVVLFGWFPPGGPQTWAWDGTNWTQQTPASSPPYTVRWSMAFDSKQRVIVLFDEVSAGPTQTWAWNGRDWNRVA